MKCRLEFKLQINLFEFTLAKFTVLSSTLTLLDGLLNVNKKIIIGSREGRHDPIDNSTKQNFQFIFLESLNSTIKKLRQCPP